VNLDKLLRAMHNNKILVDLKRKGGAAFLSDKTYYDIAYRIHCGGKMNWKNPQTFSEKLNWLKLYDRKPEYHQMVDKYEVRKLVADRIGEEHLTMCYGVWDKFDDIDFDKLPDQFVIKCTHDSGSARVISNKQECDYKGLKKFYDERVRIDFFQYAGREWPYLGVKPRIMIEEYLQNSSGAPLQSNKFFCFNGNPRFVSAEQGLLYDQTFRFDFYDLEYKQAPFYRDDHPRLGEGVCIPQNREAMIEYARRLSQGIHFLRVDLYETGCNRVVFSELTFYPAGGYPLFKPEEWNATLGEWLEID